MNIPEISEGNLSDLEEKKLALKNLRSLHRQLFETKSRTNAFSLWALKLLHAIIAGIVSFLFVLVPFVFVANFYFRPLSTSIVIVYLIVFVCAWITVYFFIHRRSRRKLQITVAKAEGTLQTAAEEFSIKYPDLVREIGGKESLLEQNVVTHSLSLISKSSKLCSDATIKDNVQSSSLTSFPRKSEKPKEKEDKINTDWNRVRGELSTNIDRLSEITKSEYKRVFMSYDPLASFRTISEACAHIISVLQKADRGIGNSAIINFEQFRGLPALMARVYPPGKGLTESSRRIDSFNDGVMIFKVNIGSSVEYAVNRAV